MTGDLKFVKSSDVFEYEKLFDDVKEFFGLKHTEIIMDPNTDKSRCYRVIDGEVLCILKDPMAVVHECVHAFFEERLIPLYDKLGEEEYIKNIDYISTDINVEEITARIIQLNFSNRKLSICDQDVQKVVNTSLIYKSYRGESINKKLNSLFSTYNYYCVMPDDIGLVDTLKDNLDPVSVYNIIAEYVGLNKLL